MLRKEFDSFDRSSAGKLSHQDLEYAIAHLGYAVGEEYVLDLLKQFGVHDTDGDGFIEFDEFGPMWDMLHPGSPRALADARSSEAADRPKTVDEAMAMDAATAFKTYDMGASGIMSYAEVEAMMKDLGYDADANYTQGLMDAFAEFDSNADGSIGRDEFAKLWEHLGGGDTSTADLSAADESNPLYKRFKQYDVNHNGKLAHYEVHQICVDLGYDADARYVQGVMDQFAKFDANADGQIEFVEFATLWEYLGGEERAAEAEKTLQVMPRPR
jgi:Ca2+-binding EF-hand superfamily protein